MDDGTRTLPDDQDHGPEPQELGPTPWFVVEGVAFTAALLGAGLLLQALAG